MKKIIYATTRWFFHTIGRTSPGMRLCLDEGLTSGKMIDYVYQNQPQGSLIGKFIDKQFLSNPGWEGVRQRRANLEILITEAILQLRAQNKSISLLDIASGQAAYILSVLEKVGEQDIKTLCRDLDDRWLVEGAQAAQAKKLQHVRFEKGNALCTKSLSSITPKPNLIVASGFYDWIVDDEVVKTSFLNIFKSMESGCFIVTNQTAHPNLDFVQQVFTDFNHQPLRMTIRSSALIQQWLEEAGFEVDKTLVDSKGYYSVTRGWK